MKETFITTELGEFNNCGAEIAKILEKEKPNLLLFYGEMGAGKTTLISAICNNLGVEDAVTSPTFAIVNEYLSASGDALYHFDLYRLEKLAELLDIGADDYFYSGNLCMIEWPERAAALLDDLKNYLKVATVTINLKSDLSREIEFNL